MRKLRNLWYYIRFLFKKRVKRFDTVMQLPDCNVVIKGRLTGFPLTERLLNYLANPSPDNYNRYLTVLLRCPWRTGDMLQS